MACLNHNTVALHLAKPLNIALHVNLYPMPVLQVLVEYDNEDWTTREWLTIYDGSWKIFLVEKTMVWSQRPDPSNPSRRLLWPALVRLLRI